MQRWPLQEPGPDLGQSSGQAGLYRVYIYIYVCVDVYIYIYIYMYMFRCT